MFIRKKSYTFDSFYLQGQFLCHLHSGFHAFPPSFPNLALSAGEERRKQTPRGTKVLHCGKCAYKICPKALNILFLKEKYPRD